MKKIIISAACLAMALASCNQIETPENEYQTTRLGINVTTEIFPEELKFASSLKKDIDKDVLAKEITEIILDYCKLPDDNAVIEEGMLQRGGQDMAAWKQWAQSLMA